MVVQSANLLGLKIFHKQKGSVCVQGESIRRSFQVGDSQNHPFYLKIIEGYQHNFTSVPDLQTFVDVISKANSTGLVINEVMRGACCMFCDIDQKTEKPEDLKAVDDFLRVFRAKLKIYYGDDFKSDRAFFLTGSREGRTSLHFRYLDEKIFPSAVAQKGFWERVKQDFPALDTNVYHKNATMRAVFSHKPQDTTVKLRPMRNKDIRNHLIQNVDGRKKMYRSEPVQETSNLRQRVSIILSLLSTDRCRNYSLCTSVIWACKAVAHENSVNLLDEVLQFAQKAPNFNRNWVRDKYSEGATSGKTYSLSSLIRWARIDSPDSPKHALYALKTGQCSATLTGLLNSLFPTARSEQWDFSSNYSDSLTVCPKSHPNFSSKISLKYISFKCGGQKEVLGLKHHPGTQFKILQESAVLKMDSVNQLMGTSMRDTDVAFTICKSIPADKIFKCTNTKKQTYWVTNEFGRFEEDKGGSLIRQFITETFYNEHLSNLVCYLKFMKVLESDEEKVKHIAKTTSKWLDYTRNNSKIVSLMNCISNSSQIFFPNFVEILLDTEWKRKNTLPFDNGFLDLKTRLFHKYNPKDLHTLTTGYSFTNDIIQDYSELQAIFAQMFPDKSVMRYFIQNLAKTMNGVNNTQIFFLKGMGSNGKSNVVQAITSLLGKLAYCLPAQCLLQHNANKSGADPHMYNMNLKRFVCSSECQDSAGQICGSRLKTISGSNCLSARDLFKSDNKVRLTNSLFIESNELPQISGKSDYALLRRIRVIDFVSTFKLSGPFSRKKHVYQADTSLKTRFEDGYYNGQLLTMLLDSLNTAELPQPVSLVQLSERYVLSSDDFLAHLNQDWCKKAEGKNVTMYALLRKIKSDHSYYSALSKRKKRQLTQKNLALKLKEHVVLSKYFNPVTELLMGFEMQTESMFWN